MAKLHIGVLVDSHDGLEVIHESSSLKQTMEEVADYVTENLNSDCIEKVFVLEFDGTDLKVVKKGTGFSGVNWAK